jgi:uncharacterized membrane protein
VPLNILILLIALAWGQILWLRDRLPERVASHFDFAGNPNGWTTRDGFLATYGIMVTATGLLLLGGALLMRRVPATMINLPNRDYWLDPARRGEALGYLETWMLWFGVATTAFLMAMMSLAFNFSLHGSTRPATHFLPLTVAFLAAVLVMTGALLRRFLQVPRPPPGRPG